MPHGDFGLEPGILKTIQKAGYVRPTPIQAAAIPKAMLGMEIIGRLAKFPSCMDPSCRQTCSAIRRPENE